jgi:hypothetical protein
LQLPGASIVVLDTYETAVELFERRSSLYSSRWVLPMYAPNAMKGFIFNNPAYSLLLYRPRNAMIELSKLDYHYGLVPYSQSCSFRHLDRITPISDMWWCGI